VRCYVNGRQATGLCTCPCWATRTTTPAGVDRRHTILPQHGRPPGQPADARHRRGECPRADHAPPRRAHAAAIKPAAGWLWRIPCLHGRGPHRAAALGRAACPVLPLWTTVLSPRARASRTALRRRQVLARGERIDRLMDQSEGLRNSADRFHRVGVSLRRKMWWQNKKMWLIAIVILLVLIFIIFLSVCFSGGNCFKS